MSKINHNNHIQSLRGIAIISVILFHTNPEFFSTGYIGVDIFFVISGYLICKVLDKNEELNKNLLCDFYIKRARRTLPALLVLVFITIPFFIYILMPVNLIDYGQSLIVTPIFLSNFLFGSENTYWGALSELKPLLHTWSLSIEWQFYLLFPLLFFFKNKLIIFITLFLLSLFSNFFINFSELQIFISDHKIRIDNFFFTTNRIWEFLAGSCLYLFEKNKKFKIIKKNYLSILGLFLIFFSFYFLDRFARENIYFNLLPVAGSCLFIYFGNERNYFDKIYKNKFLLHIGVISYSLYLWHQPILAYFKNLFNNNIPSIYYYLIYFLIYIFSIASFYLIEKSFYEKQKLHNKKFVLFIFLSILIIIFAGFLIASGKVNIENSINKKVNDIQNKYPNLDIKDIAQKRGFQNHGFFNKKFSNNGKIKIYIYGDSHSRDLFLILRLSEKITKLYEFALDDFDGADAILYTRQFYEEMLKDFEKHDIFTKAKAAKKKIIIIGRTAEFYTGNIDPLVFNLIQDPNSLNAYENNNKGFIDKNFYNILRDDVIKINKQLKIKAKEMGALYIDRVDLGCDIIEQVCHSMTTDGYPIYWDHSHLTWQGVNFFSNLVDKKNWFGPVEEFLKKNK